MFIGELLFYILLLSLKLVNCFCKNIMTDIFRFRQCQYKSVCFYSRYYTNYVLCSNGSDVLRLQGLSDSHPGKEMLQTYIFYSFVLYFVCQINCMSVLSKPLPPFLSLCLVAFTKHNLMFLHSGPNVVVIVMITLINYLLFSLRKFDNVVVLTM